ncbi:GNAT family N-acetyltransferase [Alteribacter keqinensis]|uniref:GNAT family N-acetyltransferase n=1 Tax=Alteribacter keqinensis TaxID=2483800 RepID=A0A3M7TPH3_9BACI|nr:GNAT family N-acetyltransferase [Alteribacter keqinensis]RNA67046.1 GNAT family N-acetyltransferase [Alteribacter keqinensis]
MNIRKLKEDELDTAIRMSEFAFQYELTEDERTERKKAMNPAETWVIEEEGDIQSKATVLPLNVYIGGKPWSMGGVAGVATWPEHRRSGLVRELLGAALNEMKEKGQTVSFLYPFSIPFYRKFGWELFADQTVITIPRDKLPVRRATKGSVRRVEKNDTIVGPVYDQWAQKFNGPLKRNSTWWERSVFKRRDGELAVYFNEDKEARGYLYYQVKDEVLTVHQIVWLDHEARTGLWTFISNHDSMIKEAVVTLPGDDGTVFLLDDPHVEKKVSSYFMARIVDAKSFLEAYPFVTANEDDGPVFIHLEDSFCEWNNGTYVIKPAAGGGEPVHVTHHHKPEQGASCAHPPKRGLTMTVNTLSALMLNAQPAGVLYDAGLITGRKEEVVRLAGMIPDRKPFFYDFF